MTSACPALSGPAAAAGCTSTCRDPAGGFDAARDAHRAADVLAAELPEVITTEQRKDKREMRIYADVMRTAYAQTVAANYGVRARPGAPVATPLSGPR